MTVFHRLLTCKISHVSHQINLEQFSKSSKEAATGAMESHCAVRHYFSWQALHELCSCMAYLKSYAETDVWLVSRVDSVNIARSLPGKQTLLHPALLLHKDSSSLWEANTTRVPSVLLMPLAVSVTDTHKHTGWRINELLNIGLLL